mgnify:FL=1|tara:strand:+ start:226 stop:465 length:240 start_codon:yes stop_codon:yes gene_type:complete
MTVEIENEDLSIGQILRKELIKNKDILFAGVVKPHPLISKFEVTLQSDKEEPIDDLIRGGNNAIKISEELQKKYKKLLK